MVQPARSASPVRHIERSVLRSFYHDPQYSDVTISFNGQRLHAHRFILACASKTFRTLFNTRTNTESEYPLMGYGSEAIHSMVKWIYGYDWDLDQDHSQYQQGAFYLDVWRLGLHFQLPLLVKKLDKQSHICYYKHGKAIKRDFPASSISSSTIVLRAMVLK